MEMSLESQFLTMYRYRIYYSKNPILKYTSNLDIQKIWERSFRRAKLPISYSKGFHPQPKINQALPLPLGITSDSETIDIWFESEIEVSEQRLVLDKNIHQGLEIQLIERIDNDAPKLQNIVEAVQYECQIPDNVSTADIHDQISLLLNKDQIPRVRRGKTYDLRPQIISLKMEETSSSQKLIMKLSATPGCTGRPEEVLLSLDIDPFQVKIKRTKLCLKNPSSDPC